MIEKEEIRQLFKENDAVTVTFTKKNGEERVMVCSTHPSQIPEDDEPVGSGNKEKKVNEDVMKVFDIEKQAWRSFRFDSVTKVEV